MANTSADFLLSVGINHETSLTEMQKGIQSIVEILDANPPKIKVEFDTSETEITRLRKQVEDILKIGRLGGRTASVDTSSLTQTGTEAQKPQRE